MNWLQKISQIEGIKLTDECTGHSHGQTDCLIKAYLGKRLIGFLSYAVFEGNSHIQDVEVHKDFQRMGIATRMYQKLKAESEGEIIHTMQTPEGAAWQTSLAAYNKRTLPRKGQIEVWRLI
ncbi:hypothetical protein LCGC14_1527640 [marine sediment metagenome]|uniref:N-acetyltransferase domain-containing protein n=1 Tax=marine sediment metagenome TaxID=412755 RepID=A0A0F9IWS1_9ZZZZ